MLFRFLKGSFGVTLVAFFSGISGAVAEEALSPEEFLTVYRAAIDKQITQIVDFELDTIEKIPRRGNYRRTIFVCAPIDQATLYASRGDLLQSQDEVPSQDIFTRVHLCHNNEVTVLLRRASATGPFEIYYNDRANAESIPFALSDNVDALAYASFAWFGQRWLDYFELPDAITGIERSVQNGVNLVDVSFQISENALIAGMKPNFLEATVTLEPGRDWVFRGVRLPDGGVAASHDPSQRVFYSGTITDYQQHAGMWLPLGLKLSRTTRDKEGKIVDAAIQSAEVVAFRVGAISQKRFDLKTYGLGTISEYDADEDQIRSGISTVNFSLIMMGILLAATGLVVFILRRQKIKRASWRTDAG
jgi:hypothetical protein